MSDALRKRSREPEAQLDSIDVRESKRFNGEETDLFPLLPLLEKTVAPEEEEECAYGEDFVSDVMRSLEEEISATCSNLYTPISGDNSSALGIYSGHENHLHIGFSDSDIDLGYLLEASDDELGLPSSPVVEDKDEFCESPKETMTVEGLPENLDIKCQGEIWDFEEFENYQQFALFEDVWDGSQVQQDYMNRDFISQDMFLDGDLSAA